MDHSGEVLVVDGDASIRSLLEALVRRVPRRVVAAADGRRAVALLSSHAFDALVLDLILPEVSGAEVLRFVSREVPELLRRTIVLTTMPESRWSAVGETRACAAVLRKPFSLDELLVTLRTCCNGA